MLVANNGEAPLLLHNNAGKGNRWLGIRLVATQSNRDSMGARLSWSAGGVKHSKLRTSGGSYLSSHDPREILGLGRATKLDWLEVKWPGPNGKAEKVAAVPVDRSIVITEGKGISPRFEASGQNYSRPNCGRRASCCAATNPGAVTAAGRSQSGRSRMPQV